MVISNETKQKMSLAHKGIKHSKEHKEKISNSIKRWWKKRRKKLGKSFGYPVKGGRIIYNIDGKYILRSHVSWCVHNKFLKVPTGCVIHHLDFNPKNDNIKNLILIPKQTHDKFHQFIRRN
ncbi:MAG: HNH endonuclease [Candidatus Heimdallarchaeaceae archaeon]